MTPDPKGSAMTDQSGGLLALAARCEKAKEYDGRLMAEIDCAVRFPHLRPAEPGDHPSVKDRAFNPSDIWTNTGWLMARNYYRSVDDALSLVPNEHDAQLTMGWGEPTEAVVSHHLSATCDHIATAATPALALCAAALRARAAITLATGAAS